MCRWLIELQRLNGGEQGYLYIMFQMFPKHIGIVQALFQYGIKGYGTYGKAILNEYRYGDKKQSENRKVFRLFRMKGAPREFCACTGLFLMVK